MIKAKRARDLVDRLTLQSSLKAIYDAAHTLRKPIATDKDYDSGLEECIYLPTMSAR